MFELNESLPGLPKDSGYYWMTVNANTKMVPGKVLKAHEPVLVHYVPTNTTKQLGSRILVEGIYYQRLGDPNCYDIRRNPHHAIFFTKMEYTEKL